MDTIGIYKQFLSQCDNGFAVIENEVIIEVNNSLCEQTGFNAEELVGAKLDIIFDNLSIEKILSIYESSNRDKNGSIMSSDILQKDGKTRPVEVNINVSEKPGKPYWLLIKNKSFRMEMENKLKHSELMLHTAIESLPFDFWINDAQNKTYLQNSHSKALWGDVKGSTPGEVTDDDEITEKWLKESTRALNGEIVNSEISYIIDGKKKYYRNIVAPIKDEKQLFGILGMNIDITDLKEAVEMKDMLLKEVHHRVKNNLQMIIGIMKLEESELCGGNEGCSVLDDIIHRIKVVSMIHERLYQSDINNIIHISDYLRSLVEQIVSGNNIEDLKISFDIEELDVGTDRIILLGLIINELVTNSLKYAYNSDNNHLLSLKLKKNGENIEISFSDNGPGFPSDFSINGSSSLGMRLITTFAQQLDGQLSWKSSVEGTTFYLKFPIKKAEAV